MTAVFLKPVKDMKAWELYVGQGVWFFFIGVVFMLIKYLLDKTVLKKSKTFQKGFRLVEDLSTGQARAEDGKKFLKSTGILKKDESAGKHAHAHGAPKPAAVVEVSSNGAAPVATGAATKSPPAVSKPAAVPKPAPPKPAHKPVPDAQGAHMPRAFDISYENYSNKYAAFA